MRLFRFVTFSLVLLVLVNSGSSYAGAMGYNVNFKNCSQLRAKYRLGVAINAKVAESYPATINKSVYVSNSFLDSDSDGVLCENELLQNKLNPKSQGSVVTTSTSIVVPPQSPQVLAFRHLGSITLLKGVTYIIKACGVKPWPTYLDVLSISTGWTQKATGIWGIDASFCPNTHPYAVAFGWSVTENPGDVSSMQLRGFTNEMKMNVVISK
jgi:hypothetical protein